MIRGRSPTQPAGPSRRLPQAVDRRHDQPVRDAGQPRSRSRSSPSSSSRRHRSRWPCSGTVEFLPFLLFTLPAGAWVDRLPRRLILVVGDFGRAIALLSIPIAWELGVLTIWQLYLVGFINGTLTVFFDVADQSFLPAIVEPDDLVEGNSKLQVSASAAQILGQPLGGGAGRPAGGADRGPGRRRRASSRPAASSSGSASASRSGSRPSARPTAARAPIAGLRARRSPRVSATSSATRTCATSRRAPACPTCSRTSPSRPSPCTSTTPSD